MTGSTENAPRVVVVGTGAGGAAAARELQGKCRVTILEAGREFRPMNMSVRWMERLQRVGTLSAGCAAAENNAFGVPASTAKAPRRIGIQ